MWSFLSRYYGGRPGIEPFGEARYILDSCRNCDLIYQREVLDDKGMKLLYEEFIDPDISLSIHNENPEPRDDEIQELRALSSYFEKSEDQLRALDFGMGWGRWVKLALANGFRVSAVELSERRINNVRDLDVEIIDTDDFGNRKFDLIHADQVFEHLSEPCETLRTLSTALSPTGVIHISVPPGHKALHEAPKLSFHEKFDPPNISPSMPVHPLEHINCFTQKSLLIMAEMVGLRRIKIPIWKWRVVPNPFKPKRSILGLLRPLHRNFSPNCTSLYFTH